MKSVGIDLGIKTLAVLSHGTNIENSKWYRNAQKYLRRMQKKFSRMKKDSNNYNKQKLKIAKLHEYIKNCRKDLMHKITTKIVDENQMICLVGLNVKSMTKNKKLEKSIQDASFGMFKTFIKYKVAKKDKIVVFVGRYYASSKICYKCGTKNTMLTLNDSQWICPCCKTIVERDKNAADNIETEGLRILCA